MSEQKPIGYCAICDAPYSNYVVYAKHILDNHSKDAARCAWAESVINREQNKITEQVNTRVEQIKQEERKGLFGNKKKATESKTAIPDKQPDPIEQQLANQPFHPIHPVMTSKQNGKIPVIEALIADLPEPGTWAGKEKWLEAFRATLDYLYPEDK
jgi:hypothetical protein